MFVKEVTVENQVGLHARPATFFIQKANEFKSSIWGRKRRAPCKCKEPAGRALAGNRGRYDHPASLPTAPMSRPRWKVLSNSSIPASANNQCRILRAPSACWTALFVCAKNIERRNPPHDNPRTLGESKASAAASGRLYHPATSRTRSSMWAKPSACARACRSISAPACRTTPK